MDSIKIENVETDAESSEQINSEPSDTFSAMTPPPFAMFPPHFLYSLPSGSPTMHVMSNIRRCPHLDCPYENLSRPVSIPIHNVEQIQQAEMEQITKQEPEAQNETHGRETI